MVSVFIILASIFFADNLPTTKISVLLSKELDSSGATKDYIVDELQIECVSDSSVDNQQFEKGSKITINPGINGLIVNNSETNLMSIKIIGKIRILSAKRAYGVPTYKVIFQVKLYLTSVQSNNLVDV